MWGTGTVCVCISVNETQSDLCFEKMILLHFEMDPLRSDSLPIHFGQPCCLESNFSQ